VAPLSLTQHTPASRLREFRDKSVSLTGPKCCFDRHQHGHANCLFCVWFSHGILQWLNVCFLGSRPYELGTSSNISLGGRSVDNLKLNLLIFTIFMIWAILLAITAHITRQVWAKLLNVITLFGYVLSKTFNYHLSSAVAFLYIFLILAFLNSS